MYPNTNSSGSGDDSPHTPFEPWVGASGIPSQRSPWEPSSGWVAPDPVRPVAEPLGSGAPVGWIGPGTDAAGRAEAGTDAETGETEEAPVEVEEPATRADEPATRTEETEEAPAEAGDPDQPAAAGEPADEPASAGEPADEPSATDKPVGEQADRPAAGLRPGDLPETRIVLWSDADVENFRTRLREAGNLFVDDPDLAVTSAATAVSDAVRALAATLQRQQAELDPRRDGAAPDTEMLRVAVRRYREFLERVLAL